MLSSTEERRSGMSDNTATGGGQLELQFETGEARSLLDQLLPPNKKIRVKGKEKAMRCCSTKV